MARRKTQPKQAKNTGIENSTNNKTTISRKNRKQSPAPTQENIPPMFQQEFQRAQQRFLFNIEQIQQKYCKSNSGLVLNLNKDEFEFDSELCTAENDEELIEMLNNQQQCLKGPLGDSQLSTPAMDLEQKDCEQIKQWEQLNKTFENNYQQWLKNKATQEKEGKENFSGSTSEQSKSQQQLTTLAKYIDNPPPIIDSKIDFTSLHIDPMIFNMMAQLINTIDPNNLGIILDSNPHFQMHLPEFKKLMASAGRKSNNGEGIKFEEKEHQRNAGLQTLLIIEGQQAGPSTSSAAYLSPNPQEEEGEHQLSLARCLHSISQTPLTKVVELSRKQSTDGKTIGARQSINTDIDESIYQTPPDNLRFRQSQISVLSSYSDFGRIGIFATPIQQQHSFSATATPTPNPILMTWQKTLTKSDHTVPKGKQHNENLGFGDFLADHNRPKADDMAARQNITIRRLNKQRFFPSTQSSIMMASNTAKLKSLDDQFGVPKESQDLPDQIANEKSGNSLQQMGEVIVGNNRLKAQDMAAQQNVTLRRFNLKKRRMMVVQEEYEPLLANIKRKRLSPYEPTIHE